MKQATKRFISMVTGLVLLVVALVVFFEFVQPAYEEGQTIKSRQLSQQAFLEEEKLAINQVQDLISAYQGQGEVQQIVSMALPPEEDLGGALAQLYGLARNSGIEVQAISISSAGLQNKSLPQDVRGGGFQASLRVPVGAVSFRVTMSGTYDDLKSFLSRLETNIRVFDVENLTIQPVAETDSSFNYELQVTTYYQNQ